MNEHISNYIATENLIQSVDGSIPEFPVRWDTIYFMSRPVDRIDKLVLDYLDLPLCQRSQVLLTSN